MTEPVKQKYFIWKASDFANLVELRPYTFWWVTLYSIKQDLCTILIWILKPARRWWGRMNRIEEYEWADLVLDDFDLQRERSFPRFVGGDVLCQMERGGHIVDV